MFKKYFIPHSGNDYKPCILRNKIVFGILLVVLVLEAVFLAQTLLFGRSGGFLALVLPNSLVDQTNNVRIAANLPALSSDPLLTAAAQEKANDMAAKNYFAHTSPEGLTPWYWFKKVGYAYTYAGENLAVNFSDSTDVTEAWMRSPDHRANILNSTYTRVGIATAQGNYQGAPTVFVVQLFAKPVVQAAPVTAPKPTPQPAPINVPAPQPAPPTPTSPQIAIQPTPEPPAVVLPAEVDDNQENFVAVEGAASSTVPASAAEDEDGLGSAVSGEAGEPEPVVAAARPENSMNRQSNFIQRMFAAPRLTVNVIYLSIGLLMLFALILNAAFFRAEVRHPKLVLNGLALLLALGALAVFNQQILLANAQIF